MSNQVSIRLLTAAAPVTPAEVAGLATVLLDCVEGGASVGFMLPLEQAEAQAFWRGVAEAVERGERALLVAEDGDGIVGTVHLIWAQPPNQPHRADVSKLLVHRRARRAGVGAALVRAAEAYAQEQGRWLLVLDTVTDSPADHLYARLGWQRCGVIPGYALWPQGGLCDTTFFYRELESPNDPGPAVE